MTFRIGRTLPPAASPIFLRDIVYGLIGLCRGEKAVIRFEEELKSYFSVRHCFTVSSGKAALTVILQALKNMHPDRDEVLIPAFTCYSVPSAIVRAGLKIRLCDIDREIFDYDYRQLEETIARHGDKLLCVLPVHLFGIPSDVSRIKKMVSGTGINIVEDAAQAMGGEVEGNKLGTLGDTGLFSLGRGKAFSTVEGGIILTDSDRIASHISKVVSELIDYNAFDILKLFFYAIALLFLMRPGFFWLPKSVPFLRLGETIYDPDFKMKKLSAFQAGLALGWEGKLQKLINMRTQNAGELMKLLGNVGLTQSWVNHGALSSLLRFPLKTVNVKKRDQMLNISEKLGTGLAVTYPDSIDHIPELSRNFAGKDFPQAKEAAGTLLTAPIHPFVTRSDLERIITVIQTEESQNR